MRELQTILPYSIYKNLANSKNGFSGDQVFIDLFIPALERLSDIDLEYIFSAIQTANLGRITHIKYNAIEICIIREYVKRVELTKLEELKAREELNKLRIK